MFAKRFMKFGHEVGTVGAMGAVAAQLVLAHLGTTLPIEEHALLREAIVTMVRWLLLPSLLLVLLSGMLAMAINKAFHSADWAWVKALMTPLVFETVFVAVDSPARRAAQLTARLAEGDLAAEPLLAEALWHEQGGLWIALVLFTAQIALAVWRPKRRSRLGLESSAPREKATSDREVEVEAGVAPEPATTAARSMVALLLAAFVSMACKTSSDHEPSAPSGSADRSVGAADDRVSAGDEYAPPFVDADPTVDVPGPHPEADDHPNLARIQLPPGFEIRMYAQVPNARSLELAPDGTLFVGNRSGDKVYAVFDRDGDRRADERITIASGLSMPNGVALHDGDLYVAEISRVWRFPNILERLPEVPEKVLVTDAFPSDEHHGWKYIAFGPDGKLYVPVGAPCNICKTDYNEYSNIMRMDPDGSNLETYVKGVRNSVGFDWHPETNDLWFTDNGRDRMGDNIPPDELNHVTAPGQHFGYPYCHGGFVKDPKYGDEAECDAFRAPAQNLGPHVAALGMEFYEGDMFPEAYRGQIFIAEHGSWNRSNKIGYRVTLVRLGPDGAAESYEVFAKGWLRGEEAWGRPVDLEVMPDGSMLVSDDAAGAVYRIIYTGTK